MLELNVTGTWRAAFPIGMVGILEVSGVDNTVSCPELDERKRAVEASLRSRFEGFSRSDLMAAPVLSDYERYYKSFDKTYHVQLQLESIVSRNKSLPSISPLVDANFASEVWTLVLTAAHDADNLSGPLVVDVSRPEDTMTLMNGATKRIRPGDMIMRDSDGISCSIIYGQDNRSPITAATTHALYVSYAPPGVTNEAVRSQLRGILENIRTFAPDCSVLGETVIRGRP